ncbi:MAG: heavy-metal-associated domain-containing protein [Phycisphaerae bacterium]|jgi:copper chaperone CopZ
MQTTTTKAPTTRTLAIDGMSGDTCVKSVTSALKAVPNVRVDSVKVGSAVIGSDQRGCDAACAGVTKAGFKAKEDMGAAGANSKSGKTEMDDKREANSKPVAESRPGTQSPQSEGPSGMPERQPTTASSVNATAKDNQDPERPVVNPSAKPVIPTM